MMLSDEPGLARDMRMLRNLASCNWQELRTTNKALDTMMRKIHQLYQPLFSIGWRLDANFTAHTKPTDLVRGIADVLVSVQQEQEKTNALLLRMVEAMERAHPPPVATRSKRRL